MYLVEIQNIIIPSKSAILHHKHQNTRMRRQIAPMLGSPILGVERFKFGPMLKLALFPLTLSRAASAVHIVYNSNNNIRLATIYWITNIPLEQKAKYSAFRSKT